MQISKSSTDLIISQHTYCSNTHQHLIVGSAAISSFTSNQNASETFIMRPKALLVWQRCKVQAKRFHHEAWMRSDVRRRAPEWAVGSVPSCGDPP